MSIVQSNLEDKCYQFINVDRISSRFLIERIAFTVQCAYIQDYKSTAC